MLKVLVFRLLLLLFLLYRLLHLFVLLALFRSNHLGSALYLLLPLFAESKFTRIFRTGVFELYERCWSKAGAIVNKCLA